MSLSEFYVCAIAARFLQQLLSKNNGVVGEGSFATLLDENQIRLVNSIRPQPESKGP